MTQMTIQQAMELAMREHRAGRLREAEVLYRQVLAAQPEHADALHLLGVIAFQTGQNRAAVELITRAIAGNPSAAQFHIHLGLALLAEGRVDEAVAAFRSAVGLRSDMAEAHYSLGNALWRRGESDQAVAAFRRAVQLKPDYAEAHNNLGGVLRSSGRIDEAIAAFRRALACRADSHEAWYNLGTALYEQNHAEQAIAAFREALALRPEFPEAWNNFGQALQAQNRIDEAIAAFRRAVALRPGLFEAHNNLGEGLRDMGLLDEGIVAYRQALSLRPDSAAVHFNLGVALLLRGDFRSGWKEYEWRRQDMELAIRRPTYDQPCWDGGELDGRRILLYPEQGFGDAIQFVRYLPFVVRRGGKIVLQCQPELLALFQNLSGVEHVAAMGQALPDFQVHSPLESLPLWAKTTSESIPADIPYLHADPIRCGAWRQRIGDSDRSCTIGLVWAGRRTHKNDRNRSVSMSTLMPLAEVPGTRFFSLQKDNSASQDQVLPPGMALTDWTADLRDFADTAALIENLDLVITVDTSVAHLAGALGKRVWVLLPFVPDWRWMMDRYDSPWYPTMKLFRQPGRGDWETPVREVIESLRALVGRETKDEGSPSTGSGLEDEG